VLTFKLASREPHINRRENKRPQIIIQLSFVALANLQKFRRLLKKCLASLPRQLNAFFKVKPTEVAQQISATLRIVRSAASNKQQVQIGHPPSACAAAT
jgi:hypothetical protein